MKAAEWRLSCGLEEEGSPDPNGPDWTLRLQELGTTTTAAVSAAISAVLLQISTDI